MFNLKEFLRPSTGAPALNALFAPHCFVNDNVFITKSNALCLLFEVRGIDDECASDEDLDTQGKRIQNSLKQFDESYTLYQYLIKDDAEPLAVLDQSGQADAVIETADRRRAFLEAKGLYSVRIVYAILLDNATTRVKLAQTVPGGSGASPKQSWATIWRCCCRKRKALSRRWMTFFIHACSITSRFSRSYDFSRV